MIRISFLPLTLIIAAAFLFSACSAKYNLKSDYADSISSLSASNPNKALSKHPEKENGSFIDIMERTYLNLLTGKPEIDELFRYSKKIDDQVRYKVSRELKSFFYVETPEGYYASEHEIIWMHLLLSWGFSMKGDYEKARVEAKVSSNLLSMNWSPEGRFDDPFMRVVLGCMWAMSGEWDDACVDFRMAAKLDKNLKWAQTLSELEKKPEKIVLLLGGVGPEPVWKSFDNDHKGIRGFRNISFVASGLKSGLSIKYGPDRMRAMNITADSSNWYKRHFERNNEISDIIEDAKYSQRILLAGAKSTAIAAGGIVLGTVIITGGVGIGGGLIYLAIVSGGSGAGDLAAAGIIVGGYGIYKGTTVITESVDSAKKGFKKDLDDSDVYRYVRYLPEYSWIDWNAKRGSDEVSIYMRKNNSVVDLSGVLWSETNGVSVGFFPDGK